jgi:alpha-tubulin suppressor-like RCC1 family protein
VSIGISATSLVSGGAGNYCAILISGGVDCWGDNTFGQLGNGTSSGPETCFDSAPCSTTPASVGISATTLASDNESYCAILTSASVDCWGSNGEGNLGIGTTGGPNTCLFEGKPAPCSTTPMSTGISATGLASGPGDYCAILTSGSVDCWGDNSRGELGNGTSGPNTCADAAPCSTTPVSTGISAITLTTDGLGYCATLASGGVDCWGDNRWGQLGDGTMTGPELCSDSLPCSTSPVSTGVSATSVDSDGQGYCAVLKSGAAECWGNNLDGELGDNTTMNSDVPVLVLGLGP